MISNPAHSRTDHVPFFLLPHLSTHVFANSYFSYLAVGIVPADGTDQQVRWVETYEDGQGIGQNTAACVPVYDKR